MDLSYEVAVELKALSSWGLTPRRVKKHCPLLMNNVATFRGLYSEAAQANATVALIKEAVASFDEDDPDGLTLGKSKRAAYELLLVLNDEAIKLESMPGEGVNARRKAALVL